MNAVELITNIKAVGKLWDSDIAELLGVSRHSVSMWLNGKTVPRYYRIAKLEKLLNEIINYTTNVEPICCRIKAMEILNGTRLQNND